MVHNDLREWIDDLEERNDLKRITAEVDWDEEIGAITREISSQFGPRCCSRTSKGIARLSAGAYSPTARGRENRCAGCSEFQEKPRTVSWCPSSRTASQNRSNRSP